MGKDQSWLSNIFAYIMILVCVIGLFMSAHILFERPQKVEVSIRVYPTDSLNQNQVLSAADAAALFKEIEKKEMRLEERYNYVLEQSEHEFQWQMFISIIVSIIAAICGFFGYKSIKDLQEDIRKDTKRIAEDAAQEVAGDVAKNVSTTTSKQEVNDLMPKEVKGYLDANLQTQVYTSVSTVFKDDIYNSLKQELLLHIDKKSITALPAERKKKAKGETEVVLENIAKADKKGKKLFDNK